MSPIAFIVSFPASLADDEVTEALSTAAEMGVVSPGRQDGEHFIVIARQAELTRFDLLTSEWRGNGKANVRPLNR